MRNVSGVDPGLYSTRQSWSSWDRDTTASNVFVSRPRDILELVAAMWSYRDRSIRPVGSGWSLSNIHWPPDVAIDLRETVRRSDAFGRNASLYIRDNVLDRNRTFYMMRCGARLYQINTALWRRGFSFPTLGGSHGQTLGGALSTGTHGGDFEYASVNDAVHALHVVVPGGKEFWIEPSAGRGVTQIDDLAEHYIDWHEDIEIIQEDDIFEASLIGCGRLGVIYAVIVEVLPRFYQEQETTWESWKEDVEHHEKRSIEDALRQVVSRGEWNDPLFSGAAPFDDDAHEPSFLEIHYDPKGPSAYVKNRWRSIKDEPILQRPGSATPASDAHDLGLGQFFGNLPSPSIGPEVFAAEHRKNYAIRLMEPGDGPLQSRSVFKDISFNINVGRLFNRTTWENSYKEFERHGPFVESMEFFFDAMKHDYIDFVNDVHDLDWGTICGGYIAIRYTRTRTGALLGTARFGQTVAVEVTILKGFRDAGGTLQNVLTRARDAGALSHWGQENPHSAPAIDWMFGQEIQRWRKAIPRLLGTYMDSPSNPFTREKGLEYGPSLRIGIGKRTALWLGYNDRKTSTLFHRGFVGSDNSTTALRFVRTTGRQRQTAVAVEANGKVQARRVRLPATPSAAASTGSLVVRRNGRIMAVLVPRSDGPGDFQFDLQDNLPLWVNSLHRQIRIRYSGRLLAHLNVDGNFTINGHTRTTSDPPPASCLVFGYYGAIKSWMDPNGNFSHHGPLYQNQTGSTVNQLQIGRGELSLMQVTTDGELYVHGSVRAL